MTYIKFRVIRKTFFIITLLLIIFLNYSCHNYNKKIFIKDINNHSKKNNFYLFFKKNYNKTKYIVKKGDTLYHIALIFGIKYLDIAKYNNIFSPYKIYKGQILYLKKNNHYKLTKVKNFYKKIFLPIDNYNKKIKKIVFNKILINQNKKYSMLNNYWFWPTYGKIIKNFSYKKNGNKGIDISGSYKQPIFATSSGKVVYVGNSIQGYGNLIIIKHKNNYLSAYAHNYKILVLKEQNVKAKQKIAVMGTNKSNSIRLHFEIRYKGKSVDPLHYLPPR